MLFERVIIKQIADDEDPTAIGLEQYGKSKFPGCVEYLQPAQLRDGRYITGLDPDGYEVRSIADPEERANKVKELTTLVDALQRATGQDLSPYNEKFWSDFKNCPAISTDSDLVLVKTNPYDIIKYHVLIANGYVAPNKESIGNPKYINASYYCHVTEIEEQQKVSTLKLKDKARAELSLISEDKDRMLLIGRYLNGTRYKNNMLPDTLYRNLSDYIDDKKNPDNVKDFLRAVKIPVEELQYKITVDTAIRKKLIKFIDGQYTRGAVNLGRNPIEVLANLKTPEFANEFVQIHEEVNGY